MPNDIHTETTPDQIRAAGLARGLTMLTWVLGVIGVLLLVGSALPLLDRIGTFDADAVTADDFTKRDDQALLTGTLRIDAGMTHLPPLSATSQRLSGGGEATVFVPLVTEDWAKGDPVDVYVTSPAMLGVTQSNAQMAMGQYMAELEARPDPDALLVTLRPDGDQSKFRNLTGVPGITAKTLFVWPDHVRATEYKTQPPGISIWQGIVTLLAALVAGLFARRARRAARG